MHYCHLYFPTFRNCFLCNEIFKRHQFRCYAECSVPNPLALVYSLNPVIVLLVVNRYEFHQCMSNVCQVPYRLHNDPQQQNMYSVHQKWTEIIVHLVQVNL